MKRKKFLFSAYARTTSFTDKIRKGDKSFWERIGKQLSLLETIPFSAKFGGATGNFNAHLIAYPQVNWTAFGNEFVNGILGLERSQTTTQIEHYDNMAALFKTMEESTRY